MVGLAGILRIVYTIPMQNAPSPDLRSKDGNYLRRGYIELSLTQYTGPEVAAELRNNLSVLVESYTVKNGRDVPSDWYVFGTKLAPDATELQKRKTIVGLANKLTEEFGVSAFTSDLSIYQAELDKFGELCGIVDASLFANVDPDA